MMSDQPRHSVSVAGVVVNEANQVLTIQRRDNGQWQPPGGILELGETIEHGVQREILEETGILVSIESLTGVYKNMALGVVALVFRCRPIGGHLRTSSETVAVTWMEREEAENAMTATYAERVHDALDDSINAAQRSHSGTEII